MAIRVVILSPGECITLPNNSSVTSVVIDGDATISTNTCNNLPDPTGYTCWAFYWENSASGALDDATFESLTIADNIYNVPSAYSSYNNINMGTGETVLLAEWINTDPQFAGLVKLGCDTQTGGGTYFLKIKIPEGLPAPQLKIANPDADGTIYLYLHAVQDDDCEAC